MTIGDAVKLLREARDVCEYPEFIPSSGNISHARKVRARIDAALVAYDAEPEAVETEPVDARRAQGKEGGAMNLDDLTIEEVRAIQITDIRARLAARTPGSWLATLDNDGWCVNAVLDEGTTKERIETLARLNSGSPASDASDACFIASAADDIGVLLDEVERLTTELHASQAEVVELHADPLPAAAWVREVQQAAFRRGAEAMREAAAQALSTQGNGYYGLTGSGVAKTIRALPIPEDQS